MEKGIFFLFFLTLRKIRSNEIVFVPFESIKLRETRTILTIYHIMVIPHLPFFFLLALGQISFLMKNIYYRDIVISPPPLPLLTRHNCCGGSKLEW